MLDVCHRALATTGGTFDLRVTDAIETASNDAALITWSARKNGHLIEGRELAIYKFCVGRFAAARFHPENTAIDPALVWGQERTDTETLVDNVTLFGLGQGEDRLVATDFDASGFVGLVPHASVERLVPAWHYSMLPLCKPAGAAILKEVNDDPVCTDPDRGDRAALHRSVIHRIAIDLGLWRAARPGGPDHRAAIFSCRMPRVSLACSGSTRAAATYTTGAAPSFRTWPSTLLKPCR